MSPPLRSIQFKGPEQQRGAIGLMAAVTLGLVLLFMLLVVDSGRLYLEQRKLQRVADLAVLEAVSRGGSCTAGTAPTYANESATRNSFTPGTVQKINTTCGTLVTGSDNLRAFKLDSTKSDAIRVIATTTVPTSVAGGLWSFYSNGKFLINTPLTASAVGAIGGAPLARLTINSSLVDINTANSPLLNSLIGGLLGGNLSLSAVSWQGLAAANINLLSYLDQLAINVGATAGDYNQLLNSNIQVTQLLDAAIKVLEKNGGGVTVASKALTDIKLITKNTQIIKLGDVLNIKNGTPTSGLDTSLKAFDLLDGIVQVAGGSSGATATINTNIPLIGAATVYVKIIQPPQTSSTGNPALAKANPTGPNQIAVKTAQVQARIHVDLAILQTLQPLTDALSSVLSTVLEVTKKILSLNLIDAVKCLVSCQSATLSIASSLDVYVEAASANAYVTDYSCASGGSKSLTAHASTSVATLTIGSAPTTGIFPGVDKDGKLVVSPVKLININIKTCLLALICDIDPGKAGSFNVLVRSSVSQPPGDIYYSATSATPSTLPTINLAPYSKKLTTVDVIGSLSALTGNVQTSYTPPTGKTVTGDLLSSVSNLLNQLTGALTTALSSVLSPLLDPIVNTLLKALSISLGNAEVGANLSCNAGGRAQLVL